jgi:hypothetical protein
LWFIISFGGPSTLSNVVQLNLQRFGVQMWYIFVATLRGVLFRCTSELIKNEKRLCLPMCSGDSLNCQGRCFKIEEQELFPCWMKELFWDL